jgi:hypothetical protein
MLDTRKINENTVAVAFNPQDIMLRPSGKQYYGQEKTLATIKGNKLIIDCAVADEFGIDIVFENDN